MEENRVEGLWDCSYCGNVGIKARHDKCPNCGKARGIDCMFYLPEDIRGAILTREEAAKTTNLPDWLCEYCGAYNRSDKLFCESCGASKKSSKTHYGMLHKLTGKLFKK